MITSDSSLLHIASDWINQKSLVSKRKPLTNVCKIDWSDFENVYENNFENDSDNIKNKSNQIEKTSKTVNQKSSKEIMQKKT